MVNVAEELESRGYKLPLFVGGATTSKLHTALKIAPKYSGPVVWIKDASQMVLAANKYMNSATRSSFISENKAMQEELRRNHFVRTDHLMNLNQARTEKLNLFK